MPAEPKKLFRVFISYSHQNIEIAEKIVAILESAGFQVIWDRKFNFGHGFHDQIKIFIAHSHVFLPIITKDSSERGWVHQEIGYAMALNIPVLPIAIDRLPGEMIRELHAIQVGENLDGLENILTKETITNLMCHYKNPNYALYQCAEFTEDRAIMMANYANYVLWMRTHAKVRQKGGLSSFHIPDISLNHKIWENRYGPVTKSKFHRRTLREERVALEKHARVAGCRLIINPWLDYEKYGFTARIVRLCSIIQFLRKDTIDIEVALNDQLSESESVTIVGDWFQAESYSAKLGQGFRQTIFTRHAPSMQPRIELFDQEFDELLHTSGWTRGNSRLKAIEAVKTIITVLIQNARDETDPDKRLNRQKVIEAIPDFAEEAKYLDKNG
ncbi:toll/interleukin-1 receptor domain-containing protein [uncultured Methanoregula sp.]|uniref:toll/interleukin-1 receptor domain-containing protein n=1 Tax=uncultured Methanoregula sp. TaxID=1005933 RepID=UPI002AABD3FC|nr:toll/interleukin-1 receptor domain-containing protein [uncultured Methanoregula sp.]